MEDRKPPFISEIVRSYPALSKVGLDALISDNLLSPFTVKLPPAVIESGRQIIEGFFKLRESSIYQNLLQAEWEKKGLKTPGNKSIMMSYDFHLNESGQLKLIEINTNAAFLILGQHMYESQALQNPAGNFQLSDLKSCILREMDSFGRPSIKPRIAIIDEEPPQQRLFVEFLAAQELFRSFGFETEIHDFRDLQNQNFDFIYNRFTDFYFNEDRSLALKTAFNSHSLCFSPHPYEYFLLADKERIRDWTHGMLDKVPEIQDDKEALQACLLKSWIMNEDNKDQIWSQKKNLFFKPTTEHGSKGSFRGGSISRKTFEELASKNALAQEFVPAPEVELDLPEGPQKFKYDLRFYSYRDELQLVLARLYQGQATNLRTLGGGFAPVVVG